GEDNAALSEHCPAPQRELGAGVRDLASATPRLQPLRLRLGGWHLPGSGSGEAEQLSAHPAGCESGWDQRAAGDRDRLPGVEGLLGRAPAFTAGSGALCSSCAYRRWQPRALGRTVRCLPRVAPPEMLEPLCRRPDYADLPSQPILFDAREDRHNPGRFGPTLRRPARADFVLRRSRL